MDKKWELRLYKLAMLFGVIFIIAGVINRQYINKEGLRGKQSIYIRIDNTLYNTGEYVKFSR